MSDRLAAALAAMDAAEASPHEILADIQQLGESPRGGHYWPWDPEPRLASFTLRLIARDRATLERHLRYASQRNEKHRDVCIYCDREWPCSDVSAVFDFWLVTA